MSDSAYEAFFQALEQLHDQGMALIPVPYRRKGPAIPEWQKLRLSGDDLRSTFPAVSNVGVLLGDPSANLIDVDLDSPEVRALAPLFLPPTAARFGRAGAPDSHWLYQVDAGPTIRTYRDPTRGTTDARAMLVECRWTGAQTLFPPSVHPSGETITWSGAGTPTRITMAELQLAVSQLAAAAILARHWPKQGGRHDAAMALGGGLLRAQWNVMAAGRFVGRVARAAGDEEAEDRIRAVIATSAALTAGKRVTGWPTLGTLVPDKVVTAVIGWLRITRPGSDSSDSYESDETKAAAGVAAEQRARKIPVPPFPIAVFPARVQQFLLEGAKSVGCPVDLLAVPFLVYAASANGRQRRVRIKQGWIRKSILWGAVVANSGDGKSPADSYARGPLEVLQAEADEGYQEAFTEYKRNAARWKSASSDTRDDEPTPPAYPHWFTTDPTVESLAPMLMTSSGVAASFDELIAWIKGCNAFKKGGNDRQKYLELWNGRALKVDRRTQTVLYVKDPVCCLGGGIQPERLPELSRDASVFDGLLQRFVWTYPDVVPSDWTWDEREWTCLDDMVALFRQLRTALPRELTIQPEAKDRWQGWYDDNLRERKRLPPLAKEMASKLPSHLATLWLVLHCLHDPESTQGQVQLAQLDGAITLVEYFRAHARRVLAHFGTAAPHVDVGLTGRIATILRNAEDWITQSDLWNALHRNMKANALSAVLGALLADGKVEQRIEGTGKQATTWWRWIPEPDDGVATDGVSSDSYESTNQSVFFRSDSFVSYESERSERSGECQTSSQGDDITTCCLCQAPLPAGHRLLCHACMETEVQRNRQLFEEDVA